MKLGKSSGARIAAALGRVRAALGRGARSRSDWTREWERRWSRADFAPAWLGRGAPPELEAAVADGWLPAGAPALDLGCGEGEVAAWLAQRGFPTLGVDIAPSAVARARTRHGESPGRLEFRTLDVCADPLPDRRFRAVIDRGCFHLLSEHDALRYGRNVVAASAPGARLLLLVKAFRDGVARGDRQEIERVASRIRAAFGPEFEIERSAETWLDPGGGRDPGRALPGLVFWLVRR